MILNSTLSSRQGWPWRACIALLLLLSVAVMHIEFSDAPQDTGTRPSESGLQREKKSSLQISWLNSTTGPFIRPLLTCGDVKPTKKLVFVHVLKTAGTTLRAFFADYAKKCGTGWAEMQCSAPDVNSIGIGRGEWRSRNKRNPCAMKKFVLRSGESKWHTQPIENGFVEENIDIMGGHIPLGTGNVWTNVEEDSMDGQLLYVQYIAFFRNAATKYVSGEAFWKPEKKLSDLVDETKEKVRKEVSSGQYHKKYDVYLTTPAQREEIESQGQRMSIEDQALRIMVNLIRHDVTVGITERLPQSMELLQQLIDNSGNASDLFVRYGMRSKDSKEGGSSSIKVNPSRISSSTVMKVLKKDGHFMAQLLECVKFEQQISDFALALHLRQHSSLGMPNKKRKTQVG